MGRSAPLADVLSQGAGITNGTAPRQMASGDSGRQVGFVVFSGCACASVVRSLLIGMIHLKESARVLLLASFLCC
jgi:hypothetical protein